MFALYKSVQANVSLWPTKKQEILNLYRPPGVLKLGGINLDGGIPRLAPLVRALRVV